MPRRKTEVSEARSASPDPIFEVIPFECAEIKTEPLEDDPTLNIGQTYLEAESINVAVQTTKRKTISRGVQVELQHVSNEAQLSYGTSGAVDEALSLDLSLGALEKQCRICLRRLPESSLTYILFAQKTKILNALGVKIYLGDAFPFICRNCTSLVDLMYEFRNTCQKARNMLVHERKSVSGDGWDTAENFEVIERCKMLIESHKQLIDAAYEEDSSLSVSQTETELKVLPETIELVLVDKIAPEDSAGRKLAISCEEGSRNCSNVRNDLKNEHTYDSSAQEQTDGDDTDHQDGDFQIDSEADDCAASPELLTKMDKKKRTRIVTKPYRRRQKSPKVRSYDELALQDADGQNVKKRRKNAADPFRRRGALCDFCGDWVEYHTVESHKNQHLGIKPYTCQSEGCRLSFYCRNLLIKHTKRQHRAEGPEYNDCEICGQRIKGPKAALKKHQKTHTEEKNYICAVCGKGFTTPGYLRQHSNIHTDAMPYECSVCHRRFNNKYNMLTHEKKHTLRGEISASNPSTDSDVANAAPCLSEHSQLPSFHPIHPVPHALLHPH
ncbi:zinc finger protein 195-like [Sabethes cyaneus]|uniref:zinc finger protein 195-like n=1 Tax=Sabethes cyaneus TaxID=53552 RepID=UPI00237D4099|nr:zinc finger protein 195-like [Sabethes cyaneus]